MGLLRSLLPLLCASPLIWADDSNSGSRTCKTMPGDATWPSRQTWATFNASVDGRLIQTVPIATPCHGNTFDQEQCDEIRSQWIMPEFHQEYASSIMAPQFLNKSCDPFGDVNDQCVIGAYVQYSVNVSEPRHVIRTLAFANKHNIRFVVKNTGHDYMGKSTGAGGLAVWMHHLNGTEWFDEYNKYGYHGSAVKAYAGVLGDAVNAESEERGQVVITGQCPSVGFAGGYIQGGGHSVLSSIHGMAADQALEFEVITTEGKFVTASSTENQDLFWALRGGGGGTYGIVWSATVKTHANRAVTALRVSFQPSSTDETALDTFWKGVALFHDESPKYSAASPYHVSFFDNTGFKVAMLFPNNTSEEVKSLTQPWLQGLQDLEIIPTANDLKVFPTVRSATGLVVNTFGGQVTIGTVLMGSRILPKILFEDSTALTNLYQTWRDISNVNAHILNVAISPSLEVAGHPNNAVLPAFRNMQIMSIVEVDWDNTLTLEEQAKLIQRTTSLTERLRQFAPETGTYLNEADAFNPNWKVDFYGENYDHLLKIKDKWDPHQMLYGTTAVGGDRWVTDEDGRLCPVDN